MSGPGQAAYTATVMQAVIDGHGIGEYPAYAHLEPWQRQRWEAAAQAAIDAAPVDPADLLTAAERARDEAIDELHKAGEAISDYRGALCAMQDERDRLTERVAELVTEGNDLRALVAEILGHLEAAGIFIDEELLAAWHERAALEAHRA